MGRYTYQFEISRNEGSWCVFPFDFEGATQGVDMEDACESAADWLRETVLDYLMQGKRLPCPTFDNKVQRGGILAVISVDASLKDVPRISATEAARLLSVTPGRITAMIKSGQLDGWREGRNTFVSLESARVRLRDRPSAGRPRKALPR